MDQQLDPRHAARALALQRLFTRLTTESADHDFQVEELVDEAEITDYDETLLEKLEAGVIANENLIDSVIKVLAPTWPLSQIAPVDRTILRLAIWEGFMDKQTPELVVIDEAIELAKQFGGETSHAFINGVLANLLHNEELKKKLTTNGRAG